MDFVLEVSSLSLAVSSVSSVVIASCLVFTAEEWKTKNEGMLHLEAKRSMERKAEVIAPGGRRTRAAGPLALAAWQRGARASEVEARLGRPPGSAALPLSLSAASKPSTRALASASVTSSDPFGTENS